LIVRLTSVIVPDRPATTQVDGYGVPCPESGIVIGPPQLPVERAGLADARLAATLPGAALLVLFKLGAAGVLASEAGAFSGLLLDDPIALLAIAVAIKVSAANTTSSGRSRARSLTRSPLLGDGCRVLLISFGHVLQAFGDERCRPFASVQATTQPLR
jgi:hypothetical protein